MTNNFPDDEEDTEGGEMGSDLDLDGDEDEDDEEEEEESEN